jgi:hypothetical protein
MEEVNMEEVRQEKTQVRVLHHHSHKQEEVNKSSGQEPADY